MQTSIGSGEDDGTLRGPRQPPPLPGDNERRHNGPRPCDRHGTIVEREREIDQRPCLAQTAARGMDTTKRILLANAPLPSRGD
jgi:hypothetical protein